MSKELREEAAQYMQPFGKHMLDKEELEGMREYLYAYHTSKLHDIMKHVVSITFDRPRLAHYHKSVKELEAYLSDPSASRDVVPAYNVKPDVSYLSFNGPVANWGPKYERKDLEDMLEEAWKGDYARRFEQDLLKDETAALSVVSREVFEDFMQHFEKVQKYVSKRERGDRKSFITCLLEKGCTDDLSVWKMQETYDISIMTYIISRNLKADVPMDDPDTICRIEKQFGLVWASHTCSKLAIAEIPHGVSWRVSEYDGLEKVYVV